MPLRERATSKTPSTRASPICAVKFHKSSPETSSTPLRGGDYGGSKVRKVWLMGESRIWIQVSSAVETLRMGR